MTQITLTLDLTPENLELLNEVLHRLTTAETAVKAQASQELQNDPTPAPAPKAKETKPLAPDAPQNVTGEPTGTPVSKTDVRALALKLSKAGKQETLKTIFATFGADKLSAIPETAYPALMRELEAANA